MTRLFWILLVCALWTWPAESGSAADLIADVTRAIEIRSSGGTANFRQVVNEGHKQRGMQQRFLGLKSGVHKSLDAAVHSSSHHHRSTAPGACRGKVNQASTEVTVDGTCATGTVCPLKNFLVDTSNGGTTCGTGEVCCAPNSVVGSAIAFARSSREKQDTSRITIDSSRTCNNVDNTGEGMCMVRSTPSVKSQATTEAYFCEMKNPIDALSAPMACVYIIQLFQPRRSRQNIMRIPCNVEEERDVLPVMQEISDLMPSMFGQELLNWALDLQNWGPIGEKQTRMLNIIPDYKDTRGSIFSLCAQVKLVIARRSFSLLVELRQMTCLSMTTSLTWATSAMGDHVINNYVGVMGQTGSNPIAAKITHWACRPLLVRMNALRTLGQAQRPVSSELVALRLDTQTDLNAINFPFACDVLKLVLEKLPSLVGHHDPTLLLNLVYEALVGMHTWSIDVYAFRRIADYGTAGTVSDTTPNLGQIRSEWVALAQSLMQVAQDIMSDPSGANPPSSPPPSDSPSNVND